MVEFMVMSVNGINGKGDMEGLGARKFQVLPVKGDFVTVDDNGGIGQAFEVIAIIHPLEEASTAGDLILRHVGTDLELRKRLKTVKNS